MKLEDSLTVTKTFNETFFTFSNQAEENIKTSDKKYILMNNCLPEEKKLHEHFNLLLSYKDQIKSLLQCDKSVTLFPIASTIMVSV